MVVPISSATIFAPRFGTAKKSPAADLPVLTISTKTMLSTLNMPTFSTTSPGAAEITTLFINVLLVCAAIFIVVAVWVGYSIVKFRDRGQAGEPDQLQINKWFEIIWTVIPALICVLLGWWTVVSMTGQPGPRTGEPLYTDPDIVITGAQWWWDIRYPKLGIVTANELHIPVGKPLVIDLYSNDVIHTFWIPDLGRKQQMVPGHHILLTIQSDVIGQYLGACAQYCGNQHAWMRLLMFTESEEAFSTWVSANKTHGPLPPLLVPAEGMAKVDPTTIPMVAVVTPTAAQSLVSTVPVALPTDTSVARGLKVYQQQTCGACHAIDGISVAPYAPNLSHIAGRATLGAGVIDKNTPETLYQWLLDPQQIKPGCNMPNFRLSPEQTSDLVAYLETLK